MSRSVPTSISFGQLLERRPKPLGKKNRKPVQSAHGEPTAFGLLKASLLELGYPQRLVRRWAHGKVPR